ncbi:MAG TPA: hypothetical protein VF717_13725 [Pyrinomonadaceae bacterium]
MSPKGENTLVQKVWELEAKSGASRKAQAIALTAYARVEDRVRALSVGFNLFVPKTVEPGELIIYIANLAELMTGSPRQSF